MIYNINSYYENKYCYCYSRLHISSETGRSKGVGLFLSFLSRVLAEVSPYSFQPKFDTYCKYTYVAF